MRPFSTAESISDFRTWLPSGLTHSQKHWRRLERIFLDQQTGEVLVVEVAPKGKITGPQRQLLIQASYMGWIVIAVDGERFQEGVVRLASTPNWSWRTYKLDVLQRAILAFHSPHKRPLLKTWLSVLGSQESLPEAKLRALLEAHGWEKSEGKFYE